MMFRMSRTEGQPFAIAALVAAAGVVLVLGGVLVLLKLTSTSQTSSPGPGKKAERAVGAPAGQPSATSQKSPDKFSLPKGAVVEPKDEPYGELINPDDQEWISADDTAWVRLSDEPGKHMQQAHQAFERHDMRTAATQLQRAAAQILLEADRATPPIVEGLRGEARDLDQLGQDVLQGKVQDIRELDEGMARAAQVLAGHYTQQARVAIHENRPRHAGHFLRSAANYLQKLKWSAQYFVDSQLPQAMQDLGGDAMLVSGKLIQGTGYTADEASKTIEKVSTAVKNFGEKLAQAGSSTKAPMARKPLKAVCVLHPIGDSGVSGTVRFVEQGGKVDITAEVTGLKPGLHGFHIHQYGDCTAADGGSAGGHFNPTGMPHAGPDAAKRHVGDLGNVEADQSGKAEYKRTDRVVQLRGVYSIIGRAVIVHAGQDDLTSQPSGNAGARIACGVIGLANPAD